MNGEGDTPNGSQTADQNKKNDSIPSTVIHMLGLEWKCVVDELENEVEKKSKENEQLKSRISQLEGEALSMIDNLKNTEIVIGTKFTDMSKLTEEHVYSQPTEHAGVTWKMSVHKDEDNDIWFNLHRKKENEVDCFCPVIAEFLLFSQKSKEVVHREERKWIYDAKCTGNFLKCISHKDLFDEEKGFVEDDSIKVAVAIRPLPRIIHEFPEITFHSKFTDISKLTEGRVYSEPTVHAGVTWKMSVHKGTGNRITFCLRGEKKNDVDWIYLVNAEFRLISQKSEEIIHRNERKLIYDAKHSTYWINYISPENLFNDEKGFVKNDSINVAVTIRGIPTD